MNKLKLFFSFVLICMIVVTSWASSIEGVFEGGAKILREPWGIATLFDTYFAFLTFYAWVFYRERGLISRLAWLIAILLLGNIAMAIYMLLALRKLPKGAGADALLLRQP